MLRPADGSCVPSPEPRNPSAVPSAARVVPMRVKRYGKRALGKRLGESGIGEHEPRRARRTAQTARADCAPAWNRGAAPPTARRIPVLGETSLLAPPLVRYPARIRTEAVTAGCARDSQTIGAAAELQQWAKCRGRAEHLCRVHWTGSAPGHRREGRTRNGSCKVPCRRFRAGTVTTSYAGPMCLR
jgi:hypothetical protein